jgi:hypothetical protein
MSALVGFGELDTESTVTSVGFAEFDTLSSGAGVGWCEFDTHGGACYVGWVEFDCGSPITNPVPPFYPGDDVKRYHDHSREQYDIPVTANEDEEEEILMVILMEIAKNELLEMCP